MAQDQNHREFSRSPVHARVQVRLQSGVLVEGEARDVSMNGIWFATERSLPVGTVVHLDLLLNSEEEQRIETEGTIARIGEDGVAIEFSTVDVESLEHLQRLVLYNSEDTDQVYDEFKSHLGLKRIES